MDIFQPGFLLEELCRKAQHEIVIAAPFIKVSALERLLTNVSPNAEIKCITRWRIEEILNGVSDIEIWETLRVLPRAILLLRTDLHAKYYRGDSECLIGSANVTKTALGWAIQPNLELLIPSPSHAHQLREFENHLIDGCIQVDDSLFNYIKKAVQLAKDQQPPISKWEEIDYDIANNSQELEEIIPPTKWFPLLRSPDTLFWAYKGDIDKLTTAQKDTALVDLKSLPIPPNLSLEAFIPSVGVLLLQKPIIRLVDNFVSTPQRFGAVRDYINTLSCAGNPNFDASDAWQTLMRWLLYFLPTRYKLAVPRHSEIIYRVY